MWGTAAATLRANFGSKCRALDREQATFYTDDWEAYRQVIPDERHRICAKGSGHTNSIERFNCTLRQRVSRLVRKTLSFSKKLANHIGAIKYFICHYNQEVIRLI
jgi:insertion element IS1 protein InsB